jgi:multicomponent Na+:H+ antiporter subunit E
MMRGLMIHLAAAIIWLLLQRGGIPSLFTGLVGGFILLIGLRDLLGVRDYVRRVLGFFRFGWVFVRELVLANFSLARAVLFRPAREIRADFLVYSVEELSSFEVYLLAQCITLTPGTTTVEIQSGGRELLLHAFDASDPAAVCRDIDDHLKQSILEFTR